MMFRGQRNGKSGEKIDFKFSGYNLSSNENLIGSHHIISYPVINVGDFTARRSGILGEATVIIFHSFIAIEEMQPFSPTITITPSIMIEGSKYSRSNTEAVDEDYDHAGCRSNGSAATLNLSAKFPSGQDLAPTSLLENFKIMETSYGSSFKSRITHDDREQECAGSSPPVPPSSSVMNVGSLKNLLEAAEDTDEEALENKITDLENEQISNGQTRSDLEKECKTTLSAKEDYI
ncbi:hypothetical protein L1987_04885 [Smallanthus sonchifolius]|uniref:Uncharacterized protein n=1 Tax=Smallanthus sonchifolius TaxID=185202 RepID=A0ACB9JTU2_9ASTR|nr:hypothetical protein L1987_04885 [Smallanthus sonchifolius]